MNPVSGNTRPSAEVLALKAEIRKIKRIVEEIYGYVEEPDEDMGTAEWCMAVDNGRILTIRACEEILERRGTKALLK